MHAPIPETSASTAVDGESSILVRVNDTIDIVKCFGSRALEDIVKRNAEAFIGTCDADTRLAIVVAAPALLGCLLATASLALSCLILTVLAVATVLVGAVVLIAGAIVSLIFKALIIVSSGLVAKLIKVSPPIPQIRVTRKMNSTVFVVAGMLLGANILASPRFLNNLFRGVFRAIVRLFNPRRVTIKFRRGVRVAPKIGKGVGRGASKIGIIVIIMAKLGGKTVRLAAKVPMLVLDISHFVIMTMWKLLNFSTLLWLGLFVYCVVLHYRLKNIKQADRKVKKRANTEAMEPVKEE